MKYIIDFNNTASSEDITAYLLSINTIASTELSKLDKVFIVETESIPTITSIVENIIDDTASPISLLDYTHDFDVDFPTSQIDVNNSNNWWKLSSIFAPDFDSTNTHSVRGDKVNVYVVDSGIESAHQEFVGVNIENVFSFTGEFGDTRGHGTALASVISGKTCSLTNAKICNVKIFDNSKLTHQSDMLAAFDAILAHHEASNYKVSIVNLSWSIPKNTYIESKIQKMINKGLFVVCSAGNSGVAIEDVTPASMGTVLVVGSYNADLVPSNFSNYSTNQPISVTANIVNSGALDGWAPGENIRAATLNNTYANVNGTSISSAIHASAIAYNALAFLKSSGEFAPCSPGNGSAGSADLAIALSFGRSNLLTLSSLYATSINRVTTFVTDTNTDTTPKGLIIKVTAGEMACRQLFFTSVRSIKFLNIVQLPYNLQFDGKYLLGQVPEITNNAEHTEISCEITTLEGIVKPFLLTIGVINSTLDVENAPTGDPVLDIVLNLPQCCFRNLQGNCQEGTSSCNYEYPNLPGQYPCGDTFLICDEWDGKGGQCYCG